jgi:hypothetical protein
MPIISPLTGWRTLLQTMVTIWQQRRPGLEVGWKWLWCQVLMLDVEIENMFQSVNAWGPGSPNATPTALPLIAQSRGLIRGIAETDAHHASRLVQWRAITKQTGKSARLALEIQNYLGNSPVVRVIERIAADGTEFFPGASGKQWLLPSTGTISTTTRSCALLASTAVTVFGDPAVLYQVQIRFRGVVEEKSYTGGTPVGGTRFLIGGAPVLDTYNVYSLQVSNPPATYYLNNGASGQTRCYGIDYTVTVPMYGGSTLTLNVDSRDSIEISNNQDGSGGSPYSVPGLTIPQQPIDGQFVQMDVLSATANPQARYVTANADGSIAIKVAAWDWDSVSGWTDDGTIGTSTGATTVGWWSDFWIVVYTPAWSIQGSIAPLIGQRVPGVHHDAILRLCGQWKGAHCFCRAIIWSYNAALFDPANPGLAGNPDGKWGNWSKDDGSGNQIPSRNIVDARYWIPPQG